MFRSVTGFWGFAALVAGGWMLADLLSHPKGTSAAGDTIVSLAKNTGNQVSGR
jgi:hypothetical protein